MSAHVRRRLRRMARRTATVALFVVAFPGLLMLAPFVGIYVVIEMLLAGDWWRA